MWLLLGLNHSGPNQAQCHVIHLDALTVHMGTISCLTVATGGLWFGGGGAVALELLSIHHFESVDCSSRFEGPYGLCTTDTLSCTQIVKSALNSHKCTHTHTQECAYPYMHTWSFIKCKSAVQERALHLP